MCLIFSYFVYVLNIVKSYAYTRHLFVYLFIYV